MRNLILFSAVLGGVLLYLLSSGSANTEVFSRNYYSLLVLTGLLALGLMGIVGYQLWQLRNNLKKKVFGAKLTLRLVIFFTLIGMVPGIVVYAVSVQFLGKSIESWFDVRVEAALEGGLNLARNSLDNSLGELTQRAQFTASLLATKQPKQFQKSLDQFVEDGLAREAILFSADGRQVAFSTARERQPSLPSLALLRETLDVGQYAEIDTLLNNGLTLRALVLVKPETKSSERYILQFTQSLSEQMEADAEMVQVVYQDYQELSLSRLGLKRLYLITLTLSLLIVLLAAVSAAVFISARLGASLQALASGTRAVAQGNFTGQYPIQSRDELGALTGLFNQMTRQLFEAKQIREEQRREVESAKGHLESVLTHLSSGVLALDHDFHLRSVNPSAGQILGSPLQEMQRLSLQEIAERHNLLRSFCLAIIEATEEASNGEWERQIERMSKHGMQILLMRGTRLSQSAEAGYVVVFDDISHLLRTERQAAWGEVARRLAHEIKNPLTPIQLSAERLQYKLSDKLDEEGVKLLKRATQTIVSQVGAMKNMVGDFANYARGPALQLSRLDLHKLIQEVLGLYEATVAPIELALQATQSEINGDATRLRQVIHNLLQNAQDSLQEAANPQIKISTAVSNGEVLLQVEDNGSGFPENVLSRAFEPYMTTKTKGTGLGLAIVKKIIEEHGGQIDIENIASGGARVNIHLPLAGENE